MLDIDSDSLRSVPSRDCTITVLVLRWQHTWYTEVVNIGHALYSSLVSETPEIKSESC